MLFRLWHPSPVVSVKSSVEGGLCRKLGVPSVIIGERFGGAAKAEVASVLATRGSETAGLVMSAMAPVDRPTRGGAIH
jgi:hypothetical protein